MPKPHVSKAPPAVQRAIAAARKNGRIAGGFYAAAAAQLSAMEIAYRRGYDWPPEEVEAPRTAELARLQEARDWPAIIAHKRDYGIELEYERKCIRKAAAMRKWASEPSNAERAAVARADVEQQQQAQRIAARTEQILAEQHVASRTRARKQAEKELSNGNA